jgi:uncharacterized membrane protein HdeD (DUF308 family)
MAFGILGTGSITLKLKSHQMAFMAKEDKLRGSKDALLLEGIGMSAVGAAALFYPGRELAQMLPPIGILLLLNGAARLLFGVWILQWEKEWRKLLWQIGWTDLLTGIAALVFARLNIPATIEIFAAWLVFSGYYHIRRSLQLDLERTGKGPLGILGFISIAAGLLFWGKALTNWFPIDHHLSLAAIMLGLAKIYGFFKLGRVNARLSRKEDTLATAGNGE